MSATTLLWVAFLVFVGEIERRGRRRCRPAASRCGFPGLTHRTRGRIAADLILEIGKVDELIRLPAQLVGHHRGLGLQRGDHAHPAPLRLQGSHQSAEIAVAGKQYDVIQVVNEAHGIDAELDVHVALDLAPAERVRELLVGLVTMV